jgi:hypothetical protein
MSQPPPRFPREFVEVLGREFGGDARAVRLFRQFMTRGSYSRAFASALIDVAQGRCDDSWEVRRLATLMLQQHLLSLRPGDAPEFAIVLGRLGLEVDCGGNLPGRVLEEGYSRRDLRGFIREFRRRLARPWCAVRPGEPGVITAEDVRAFARLSRQECKLVLARATFAPEEVVARAQRLARPTAGLPVAREVAASAGDPAAGLPDYEAKILRGLVSSPLVYWVGDGTPSELNSLVEYPVGTVVLVVKPPGSHHEFELKRAGRRGAHSLSVRSHVPPSHRLDGGSMIASLQWDAEATASLSGLYRLIHGEDAPVSRVVSVVGKYQVPVGDREYPIVEFLTHSSLYGEGYDAMRAAMEIVVKCFRQERGDVLPPIPGDYGLTAQFLALTGPAQAVLRGSSSFRLDQVARYLSGDGPAEYFGRGLGVAPQAPNARRLADDVLDEVLGVYAPPEVAYEDHDRYVAAALEVPANRARADAVYLDLLGQIGKMWGTLLGLRGYSFGESFVSRNVGLRTVWSGGAYRVRLVFQDHDNLALPSAGEREFRPASALLPTMLDARYIHGREGDVRLEYEVHALNAIYRAGEALRAAGQARLRRSIRSAYAKTQRALQKDPRARSRFDARFLKRLRDWDAVARIYLAGDRRSGDGAWKGRVGKFLRARGYGDGAISGHLRALEEQGSFVEDYAFLFRARSVARSASDGRPSRQDGSAGHPPLRTGT